MTLDSRKSSKISGSPSKIQLLIQRYMNLVCEIISVLILASQNRVHDIRAYMYTYNTRQNETMYQVLELYEAVIAIGLLFPSLTFILMPTAYDRKLI